ncbi:hypothetical protein B0H16DRAFT_1501679 [Mycena metata]|uniref:Uncharacterized protein n=1 Tax=Mycena metata TaxID=1033252 RepID=A0AAD7K670_9AGAR|nr:hypothetical protein B0H16DRAFT_1501679 [Mycena metata]
MSYPTKIAFPCPPPTTNSLSQQQRSQLLRTTQKLGRLLGTTPALIEESDSMPSMLPLNLQRLAVPLHIQLSSVYSDDEALTPRYPSSETLVSSGSERGSPTSSLKRSSSLSSTNSGRSTPTKSVHVNESWPTDRPFLRIATKNSSKLEAIPQSPPARGSPPPAYSVEPPHTSFTIRPIPASRHSAYASPPAFCVPSNSSIRRQKMDKLRRTLGDGVPLDLVFPDEETQPVPMLHSPASSDEDLPRTARPPPPHRIRAARDSLLVPQPSRQQRFAPQATRPAPPPPPMVPTPRDLKKLSIIAEREEPSPPSPSDRASTESERYQGDTEADFPSTRHRRSSRLYDQVDVRRVVKRVPVPYA